MALFHKSDGVRADVSFRVGRGVSRRLTLQHHLEECARERRAGHMGKYGPPPYTKWEPMTDTANTLCGQEVTGNTTLPRTKEDWENKMVELRRQLQWLFLGGVGHGNVSNVYGCLDDEEGITD